MQKSLIISALALTLLAGCNQLSDGDRAALDAASRTAREAKQQSIEATEEARRARADADRAAAAAEASREKADRIFREGQNK